MFDITAGAGSPDNVAHVIQVSLAPVFLLRALATLFGIFSTRLARVADQVDAAARDMLTADAAEARSLSTWRFQVRLQHPPGIIAIPVTQPHLRPLSDGL